jgi:hypothetical protein
MTECFLKVGRSVMVAPLKHWRRLMNHDSSCGSSKKGRSVNVHWDRKLSPHPLQPTTGNCLRLVREVLPENPFQEAGICPGNFVNRFASVVAKREDDHAVLTPHELTIRVHDVGILHCVMKLRDREGRSS